MSNYDLALNDFTETLLSDGANGGSIHISQPYLVA